MDKINNSEQSIKNKKAQKIKKTWYKKIPKSRGRNACDELWSILVKLRDGKKCVICGDTEKINSHHLISRKVFKFRFLTINGISVCGNCHFFSLIHSFHTSPWACEKFMSDTRPEQYATWVANRNSISEENEKFIIDYDEIYYTLEKEHKEKTGAYFKLDRIASYILFKNIDKITLMTTEGKRAEEICKEFSVPLSATKEFLTKNKMR